MSKGNTFIVEPNLEKLFKLDKLFKDLVTNEMFYKQILS